jgi:hypothetical protein
MVAEEYNDPAGVYKVQTFGTLQNFFVLDRFICH